MGSFTVRSKGAVLDIILYKHLVLVFVSFFFFFFFLSVSSGLLFALLKLCTNTT